MKNLLLLAILFVVYLYGSAAWSFSEMRVNDFLNHWVESTLRNDPEWIWDTAANDMTFSIDDASAGRHVAIEGNEEEFCDYVRKTTPMMAKMSSSVRVTRDDLKIERHEDRLTLVKTWKGLFRPVPSSRPRPPASAGDSPSGRPDVVGSPPS